VAFFDHAKEAAACAIDHAFNRLGLPQLVAGHHPDNAASSRILLQLGFERAGSRQFAGTGLVHPHYVLKAAEFTRRGR
jgi:RimJ/RimL family protein N-acetyltransferase